MNTAQDSTPKNSEISIESFWKKSWLFRLGKSVLLLKQFPFPIISAYQFHKNGRKRKTLIMKTHLKIENLQIQTLLEEVRSLI